VDVETTTAIERLTARIDTLETSVRGDIAQLSGRVDHLGGRVEHLGGRVEHLDGRVEHLDADAVRRDERLRAEIAVGLADARRHALMLNEATRDDIRLVAEAVALLTVKVEALDSRLR
jgi:hypothetical protein